MLLQQSIADSTTGNYQRSWRKLHQFCKEELGKDAPIPVDVDTAALFLSDLHRQRYAVSTISTHMAALSYIHKLNDWPDPSASFLMKSLMNAVKKDAPRTRAKLQITLPMLHELLSNVQFIFSSAYDKAMYHALFLLQFHSCARIGELVISGQNTRNVLQLDQVGFQRKPQSDKQQLTLDFMSYKHSKIVESEVKILEPLTGPFCPVQAVQEYIRRRGNASGPLFLSSSGQPITRTIASKHLKHLLTSAGYDSTRYDTHGLRIGRASQAAEDGWRDSQIQKLGRWKSSAYKNYICRPATAKI